MFRDHEMVSGLLKFQSDSKLVQRSRNQAASCLNQAASRLPPSGQPLGHGFKGFSSPFSCFLQPFIILYLPTISSPFQFKFSSFLTHFYAKITHSNYFYLSNHQIITCFSKSRNQNLSLLISFSSISSYFQLIFDQINIIYCFKSSL